MSLEKIVKSALAEQPIEMKEAFEESMKERIAMALEEKYKKMADSADDMEDEADSDDEDDDAEDDKKKKDDEDEDDAEDE